MHIMDIVTDISLAYIFLFIFSRHIFNHLSNQAIEIEILCIYQMDHIDHIASYIQEALFIMEFRFEI